MKPRAGLYTRVSTAMQKERYSLPAQEALLREYAEKNSMVVVDHYQDAGLSAKNTNRPELQRLMRDCTQGKLDAVLVVELDRTTRNVQDMLTLSQFFQEHNVQYIELTDENTDISTPDGFLKRTIKSTISQYERMHTGERVKRTKKHRAQQGKRTGGGCPFGYTSQGKLETEGKRAGLSESEAMQKAVKFCPERGKLYVVPDEAALVKDIFDTFLRVNSIRKTAHALNMAGKRTHTGGLWTQTTIRRTLTNPVYVGKLRASGVLTGGEQPAIVSEELFNAVQKRLPKSLFKPVKAGYTYLFSGIMKCGYCGAAMAGEAKTAGTGDYHYSYYKCTRSTQQGKAACQGQYWRADHLESYILDYLKGLAGNGDFLFDTRSNLNDIRDKLNVHDIRPELERLDKEIQTNKRRISVLLDKLADEVISDEDFQPRHEQLKAEISGLETTRARLQEEHAQSQDRLALLETSFDELLNFWNGFDELTRKQRQARLRTIIEEVSLNKAENKIDVKLLVGEGFEVLFDSSLCEPDSVNNVTQRETMNDLLQGRIAFTLNYEHKKKTA